MMSSLSGGEKTKVFLAGLDIHHPSIVLMDEPTNHLDTKGRTLLYVFHMEKNRTKRRQAIAKSAVINT